MKKILVITLEYPPQIGGIASYIDNFVSHLDPNRVVVYAPKVKDAGVFDGDHPWKVYRYKPYWFLWPHWLRMFFQIRHIVKQEQIEILHVHHCLPVGYVAWLIKKMFKIPYVVFFHGTDVEMASRTHHKKEQMRKIINNADAVFVNSEFLKNKLLNKLEQNISIKIVYPCPADSFFQVIPPDKLRQLKARLALDGKKVIVTVARFTDGKGYPHLVNMFPQIIQSVPNVVWLIIGDGPKRQMVMEQARKLNVQNSIRYEGNIPHEDLPAYLQIADLFVLLTHPDEGREEGWGTVFLEAAASGLPAVAGQSGGVGEAVKNLETGLVVDVHQTKSVIASIVGLLNNTNYARQMGAAAKARAETEFRWQKQMSYFR